MDFLLMTLLPQALLALVSRHFMALSLTTTRHMRILSFYSSLVFMSCAELKAAAIVSQLRLKNPM
jgi:hypothetical protein